MIYFTWVLGTLLLCAATFFLGRSKQLSIQRNVALLLYEGIALECFQEFEQMQEQIRRLHTIPSVNLQDKMQMLRALIIQNVKFREVVLAILLSYATNNPSYVAAIMQMLADYNGSSDSYETLVQRMYSRPPLFDFAQTLRDVLDTQKALAEKISKRLK